MHRAESTSIRPSAASLIRSSLAVTLALLGSAAAMASPASAQDLGPNQTVHPDLLEQLEYRSVGPARGGRSTAVSGFADDPYAYVMGTTGGGVWMTDDVGESWVNVTDDFLESR